MTAGGGRGAADEGVCGGLIIISNSSVREGAKFWHEDQFQFPSCSRSWGRGDRNMRNCMHVCRHTCTHMQLHINIYTHICVLLHCCSLFLSIVFPDEVGGSPSDHQLQYVFQKRVRTFHLSLKAFISSPSVIAQFIRVQHREI